jgi:hypothetical protein
MTTSDEIINLCDAWAALDHVTRMHKAAYDAAKADQAEAETAILDAMVKARMKYVASNMAGAKVAHENIWAEDKLWGIMEYVAPEDREAYLTKPVMQRVNIVKAAQLGATNPDVARIVAAARSDGKRVLKITQTGSDADAKD